MIPHSELDKDCRPYKIKELKDLPLIDLVNKLTDILDFLQNQAFYRSSENYYKELKKIIEEK